MRRGRREPAAFVLAWVLSVFVCLPMAGWAGIDPFSPGSMKSAVEEEKRREEYSKQIRKLVRTGGEEGARGLRAIVAGGNVPQQSRNEAIEALGSLKRPEDVPFLLDWPLNHRVEEARKYGEPHYVALSAAATIGGDEACRGLKEIFTEALRADSYKMRFNKFAEIMRKGACLSGDELVLAARAASHDMWADYSLHRSALEYLAESGDEGAKASLQKLDRIEKTFWGIRQFPMDLVPSTLHDPEVPWDIKSRLMDVVMTFQRGAKEDLFDLYFDLAVLLVTEKPNMRFGKSRFSSWANRLTSRSSRGKSHWATGDPVNYFEEKRRRYRNELDGEAFKHMDEIIAEARQRLESNQAEEERLAKRSSVAIPTPAEPAFVSFGSRLRNSELFVFDEEMRWYGVARLDLFLAAAASEQARTHDESKKQLIRQRAQRALSIEGEGAVQGIPAPLVLMTVPPGFAFDGAVPEWSPRTGEFSAAFVEGQERLIVMRLTHEGPVSFWVNIGGGVAGGTARTYRFREDGLPAGSAIVLALRRSAEPIPVYVSRDGKTVAQRFLLQADGAQKEVVTTAEDHESKSIQERLGEVSMILRSYEDRVLTAAGGAEGVRRFRDSLREGP